MTQAARACCSSHTQQVGKGSARLIKDCLHCVQDVAERCFVLSHASPSLCLLQLVVRSFTLILLCHSMLSYAVLCHAVLHVWPNRVCCPAPHSGTTKFRLFSPMQALQQDAKALVAPLSTTTTDAELLSDPGKLRAAARQLDGRAVKLLPDERWVGVQRAGMRGGVVGWECLMHHTLLCRHEVHHHCVSLTPHEHPVVGCMLHLCVCLL